MTDVGTFDGTWLALPMLRPPDAPVVVLLQEPLLSTSSRSGAARLLAGAVRMPGYDLQGRARSGDAASGGCPLAAHPRDLHAVLREVVPPDQRAVSVGSSLGGCVPHAHADGRDDDQAEDVVALAASGGSGVTLWGLPARGAPQWAQRSLRCLWLRTLRGAAAVGRVPAVQTLSDRLVRRLAFTPHICVACVQDCFLSPRPHAPAATTLAIVSHRGVRMRRRLNVPTLAVHGIADPEVPADEVRELLDALPDGELVTSSGQGHLVATTEPETVAAHISRCARRVGPAGLRDGQRA